MFITMPITHFKLNENKLTINKTVVEYEEISEDAREILESLISKGAYGSALLTLNMFYNVKSINESDYTQEDYSIYLGECNKLMEECVSETEAHNFRPLINLGGLEIMEGNDCIARGKGDKLLIEDFRKYKLDESDNRYTGNSHADEVVFDFSQTERDIESFTKALNEISRMEYDNEIDKDTYDKCIKRIQELFKNKNMSIDEVEKLNESDDSHVSLEHLKEIKDYIEAIITEMEKRGMSEAACRYMMPHVDCLSIAGKGYICLTDDIYYGTDDFFEELMEECEGTQCSDIAEKKDQEVGKLQKAPKKKRNIIEEALSVPKNHKFKGFMKNESGMYTRGNFVLINENGTIKAVNKNKLKEEVGPYNQSFEVGSKLDLLLSELQTGLHEGLNALGYDEEFMKDFCKIEAQDDEDDNNYMRIYFLAELDYEEGENVTYYHLDPIIKKYDKDSYFEAETSGRWIALVNKKCLK